MSFQQAQISRFSSDSSPTSMSTSDIPEGLLPFCACSARALSNSSRAWLSKHLNPEMESLSSTNSLLQDWRGVAEFLLFTALDIDNFAREKSPTAELLRQWAFQDTSTIGKLLEAIEAVERFDILNDEQLEKNLGRDCTKYQNSIEAQMNEASGADGQPIQVQEVTSEVDESKNITVGEVTTGVPEYFDAFVCYTHQDFEFVRQMMHKLETVHGLKLCIVSRDLMPGCAEYVIMAKLIQERCRKMIIVLSPDYINSKECAFQTRFAHSLAPGAKEKKLIPVIYRPCGIPPILNHICTVDYTRCDVVEWFWVRLANSLKETQRADALIPDLPTKTTTFEHKLPPTSISGDHSQTGTTSSLPGYFRTQGIPTVPGIVATRAIESTSRNSSANSLTETSPSNSWTDLSVPSFYQQDEIMSSLEMTPNAPSLSDSAEMAEVAPTNTATKSRSKLLRKFFPFKKH